MPNYSFFPQLGILSVSSLFATTSQSPMSKLFKFLESLGESNGKNWSQIWKLSLIECVKLLLPKKFLQIVFFISSLRFNVFLPQLPKVKCPKFLDFRNLWGEKINEAVSDLKSFAHKRCKIAAQKSKFFGDFCLPSRIFWYRCYDPHWSRDSLSSVCRIFFIHSFLQTMASKLHSCSRHCNY